MTLRRPLRCWPLALGFALAAAAYLPRLGSPLSWDDRPMIEYNGALDGPIPWRAYLSRDYFRVSAEGSWRPLATLSYRSVIGLFGKSPAWLRLSSLLLHGCNGVLLCWLLCRLKVPRRAAAWAGALFLVHPVHAEALMCVSFNEDPLIAFGMLTQALAHLYGRPALAGAGFCAAMLSKETGALGVFLPALCDLLAGGGWPGLRRKAGRHALFFALLSGYLFLRLFLLKGPMSQGSLASSVPAVDRIFFGLSSLGSAFRLFIAPAALRIEYFALPAASPWEWLGSSAAAAACACALAASAAAARRRAAGVRALLLWSLPFLAATSGFLPAEPLNMRFMAERFLYVPLLAFCACAAWLLRSRPALASGLLAGWALLAGARAADWSREAQLWQGLCRDYPLSAKAREGLGQAFFRGRDYPQALEAFEEALVIRERRLDPVLAYYAPKTPLLRWESPGLQRWLGMTRMKTGDLIGAEAGFKNAIELEPRDPPSYRALAYLAARRGRFARSADLARRGLSVCGPDPVLARLESDSRLGRLAIRLDFN